MDTFRKMALHDVAIGKKTEADGTFYTAVYREKYLDETTSVFETFGKHDGKLLVVRDEDISVYSKYDTTASDAADFGVPTRDVFEKGEDVLGNSLERVDFYKIRKMLPPYHDDAYIALGHPANERAATVDRFGRIFRQKTYYSPLKQLVEEECVYEPSALFGELGAAKPTQSFLDGKYPILYNVHEYGERVLESLYILETGTFRSGGALYVRNVVTDKNTGEILSSEYRIVGTDCFTPYDAEDAKVSAEIFYDCMLNVIGYFEDFEKNNAKVTLPIKELERSHIGTMFTLEGLFSAERMRYGHRIYGAPYHDFFPPNFIVALLAYSINGQTLKAGRLAQYVLANAVDGRGRILYRQGDGQNYGFSASELGQFLWILSRYEGIFEPHGCLRPYNAKILAMGNFLLSRICKADEIPDVSVIRTCAEADTNERVHDYLENTLWGIRGLEAICSMSDVLNVDTQIYREAADKLRSDIGIICKITETDTPYGKAIPFRLGYTAEPLTLSQKCRTTARPMSDGDFAVYAKLSNMRSDFSEENAQDLVENSYANYRYYPEMLSSCILGAEYEKTILRMREALGGELLGMIRWGYGMDDWPAYNLAINFMERGEKDKFLKLLYAHACHHGLLDFHIYYEQIILTDKELTVRADSSVPSIMLNNLMINMMFCYERVDSSEIELMKGVPSEWIGREEISIDNVYTSKGRLSLLCTKDAIRLSFDGDFDRVRLYLGDFDSERLAKIAELNDCVKLDDGSLIITAPVGEKMILLA